MIWMIFVGMAIGEPFAIPILEFETQNECIEYVNNPENSDRLAIEVIAQAGFNDTITEVSCLHKGDIHKRIGQET
jgi:hypothetical protein|tara:strand:+ start:2714 stop:2938 length:225 start_codon:yes stop_codon:yes gene_type:complete